MDRDWIVTPQVLTGLILARKNNVSQLGFKPIRPLPSDLQAGVLILCQHDLPVKLTRCRSQVKRGRCSAGALRCELWLSQTPVRLQWLAIRCVSIPRQQCLRKRRPLPSDAVSAVVDSTSGTTRQWSRVRRESNITRNCLKSREILVS